MHSYRICNSISFYGFQLSCYLLSSDQLQSLGVCFSLPSGGGPTESRTTHTYPTADSLPDVFLQTSSQPGPNANRHSSLIKLRWKSLILIPLNQVAAPSHTRTSPIKLAFFPMENHHWNLTPFPSLELFHGPYYEIRKLILYPLRAISLFPYQMI